MTTTAPVPIVAPPAAPPVPETSATPRVAWRAVLLLAGVVALVHGVSSAWYGAFGDELYFVAAGRHLAWGYADQPPLVPWLAAGLDAIAPGNLVVLRLPVTLTSAAHVVVTALLAAELGGRRRAQLLAGAAITISPFLLATGHLLATSTLDPFLWSVLLWLVVRWIRVRQDRLLIAAGLVLAVALAVKFLVPVLVAGLALGVLWAGPRRLLGRPALWLGLALAAASTVPTLLWQAAHGWPQLQMGEVVAGEGGLTGNRWSFLPFAAWDVGLVPGMVLAGLGLWGLLRTDALRPWRAVGIAAVATTAAMIVAGGRPYYVMGLAAVLVAAGAVVLQDRRPARWWGWSVSVPAYVASALVVAVIALPLGPASWRVERGDFLAAGQVGWQSLAASTGAAYRALPPEQRAHTTVLAFSYWYAAALDRYGPEAGLPDVYSGHRGFAFFGPPPDTATAALLVGSVDGAAQLCGTITPLPAHRDPTANAVINGDVPLALCTLRAPWSASWASVTHMQ
ncbi:4-amino-4-deoxy-L-arabinose transferase-like glycosyltransferase [Actinomycetospora succinea]|uniref:4-amino-4-deoxy-L-arabinose transferase-like glycosyltransferase n=1 Tax=Actinomycetospora succinea TaxID=663603 RepID=A0A4R6VDM4_9PSEU|nr:glycosyltransferase family 39 protein [Actinomycetospora succinea]TDQ60903.1 4-amino-4-deoxy-L-arabinose transferase-like glycosyltransferase [Actinomycetospora succinea]